MIMKKHTRPKPGTNCQQIYINCLIMRNTKLRTWKWKNKIVFNYIQVRFKTAYCFNVRKISYSERSKIAITIVKFERHKDEYGREDSIVKYTKVRRNFPSMRIITSTTFNISFASEKYSNIFNHFWIHEFLSLLQVSHSIHLFVQFICTAQHII